MVFWEMGLEATKARKMPWPVSSLEQNFRYQRILGAIRPAGQLNIQNAFPAKLRTADSPSMVLPADAGC